MTQINGYVGSFTRCTDLLPRQLVDKIFRDSGVLEGDHSPRKGEPHFKYHWHVPLDVFLIYLFEDGLDQDGDPFEFVTPAVKATMWPQTDEDLVDQIPNLEPAIILEIEGRFDDADEWWYSAWVNDEYLQTAQGQLLSNKLMLAKLALDPFSDNQQRV